MTRDLKAEDFTVKEFKCPVAPYHMKSWNECMECAVTFCDAHPSEIIPVVNREWTWINPKQKEALKELFEELMKCVEYVDDTGKQTDRERLNKILDGEV